MPKSSSAVRAVGLDEQVPAVEVAMEDAVDQRALHEADHPGAHDLLGVDAGVLHAGHVVELEAVEPLHDQHPLGDERGVRAGDHVVALAEVGERLGHVEHVLGLEAEVELLGDRLGEQLDERRRVGQGGDRDAADHLGREPGHDPQVLADEPWPRVGRCTLTTTSSPVRSVARWTWAIEAAASGVVSNDGEQLVDGTAEVGLDDLLDLVPRSRAAPGRGTSSSRRRAPRGTGPRRWR